MVQLLLSYTQCEHPLLSSLMLLWVTTIAGAKIKCFFVPKSNQTFSAGLLKFSRAQKDSLASSCHRSCQHYTRCHTRGRWSAYVAPRLCFQQPMLSSFILATVGVRFQKCKNDQLRCWIAKSYFNVIRTYVTIQHTQHINVYKLVLLTSSPQTFIIIVDLGYVPEIKRLKNM